jgi:prepilin-type N-terminal cleavage/methylation domain-containing protein
VRRDRLGFTLVELLVALAIGAAVLFGARGLLDGIGRQASDIARAMRRDDARANARRAARQIAGNAALAPTGQPTFAGTPTEASFTSWCPSVRGGLESCHVRLAVVQQRDEPVLTLALSTGTTLVLGRGAPAGLRYLADAGDGGRWDTRWAATQSPPVAVAASAGGDVLFLRIGERR